MNARLTGYGDRDRIAENNAHASFYSEYTNWPYLMNDQLISYYNDPNQYSNMNTASSYNTELRPHAWFFPWNPM